MRDAPQILVIEDHALVREALGQLLREYGYQVFEAENGIAGIAAAQELHPDVILTDYDMPGVDGAAVIRAVQSDPELKQASVIVVSIHNDPKTRRACMQAGPCVFLDKATRVADLLATLDDVLARRAT